MAAPTSAELRNALDLMFAVSETIRELGEVPSGVLYSQLLGRVTYEGYQGLLRALTNTKLIKVENHLITWIGPKFGPDGRRL